MERLETIKEILTCVCRLKIMPFFSPVMPKNVQEWQNLLLAIPMNWQIQGHPSTKDISRNVSFYSGMAVFLTFQSCGLACPQHLILTLCEHTSQIILSISVAGED